MFKKNSRVIYRWRLFQFREVKLINVLRKKCNEKVPPKMTSWFKCTWYKCFTHNNSCSELIIAQRFFCFISRNILIGFAIILANALYFLLTSNKKNRLCVLTNWLEIPIRLFLNRYIKKHNHFIKIFIKMLFNNL